jgi:hypothetical protein
MEYPGGLEVHVLRGRPYPYPLLPTWFSFAAGHACMQDGWTALHFAANEGHFECLKELLDKGAAVDLADKVRDAPCVQAPSCQNQNARCSVPTCTGWRNATVPGRLFKKLRQTVAAEGCPVH